MLRPEDCKPGALVTPTSYGANYAGSPLVMGAVYTIRAAEPDGEWIMIELCEVDPPPGFNFFGNYALQLLPDERLSIFRAMLAKSPVPVKEGV